MTAACVENCRDVRNRYFNVGSISVEFLNKRSTKSASRGVHSPVRGHPRGSKVVPLNSWGRVSY